jgi:hypothetical protein
MRSNCRYFKRGNVKRGASKCQRPLAAAAANQKPLAVIIE